MIKKPELIDGWKKSTKLWSMRFSLVGTALMSLFVAWPDSALYLWAAMPEEVRSMIPDRFVSVIALFIFGMSSISRIVKQRPIDAHQDPE